MNGERSTVVGIEFFRQAVALPEQREQAEAAIESSRGTGQSLLRELCRQYAVLSARNRRAGVSPRCRAGPD